MKKKDINGSLSNRCLIKNMKNISLKTKIVYLGASYVGKTRINNYLNNKIVEPETTLGCSFNTLKFEESGQVYQVDMFDTCGQERYAIMTKNVYRDADIFILVFALDDKGTRDKIHFYIDLIKQDFLPTNIILVGNKCDLLSDNEITQTMIKVQEEIENVKYELDSINYVVVSGLNGYNIDTLKAIIKKKVFALHDDYYLKRNTQKYNSPTSGVVNIQDSFNVSDSYNADKKERKCCIIF